MPSIALAVLEQFHPEIVRRIRAAIPADWTLYFPEDGSVEEKVRVLRNADAAFVMASPVPADLLASAPKLKFLQKLGIGVDRIDLVDCASRGIIVAKLQASNALPVAEHALLLILACLRQLPLNDRLTRAGGWAKEEARGVNRQLSGKTLGILGFGAIGQTLARLVSGFDVGIVYYDPMRASAEVESKLRAQAMSLDEVIARADILSLHLPLIEPTRNILSADRIAAMKPGAVLINTARGGLVDETALAKALQSGHLFGAGIDAFAQEPPDGNPLLKLDQTVITPHFAGATIDNFDNVIARAISNTVTVLAGGELPGADRVAY